MKSTGNLFIHLLVIPEYYELMLPIKNCFHIMDCKKYYDTLNLLKMYY